MRVSDASFIRQFLAGLRSSRTDISRALEQLADQKRVRVASDDPVAAHTSLNLRGTAVRLDGYIRTAGTARFDLATVDGVLGEATNLVTAARTEAMAGATDALGDVGAIRAETVEALRDQLLLLANTEQNGRYLFAGTETLTAPFDAAGTYAGDDNEVLAPIDPKQQVAVTLSGREVFQGAAGDLLQTLDDLATALRAGDHAAIEAQIPVLRRQLDHLGEVRAEVGHRMVLIDNAVARNEDQLLRLRQRISELEDAPLEETAVRLTAADNQLRALSGTASRVLGRSLFDFLG